MVLERAGFVVQSVSSDATIEEEQLREIDLALICHSVRTDRAIAISNSLKAANPAIYIVQLTKTWLGYEDACGKIDSTRPDELIRQLGGIIANQRGPAPLAQ
jgi:hypothetical protein